MLIRDLQEALHKSYYDKKFYTLAKSNSIELGKMILKFFRKKGVTFANKSSYGTQAPLKFKDIHRAWSPDIRKELLSYGLSLDEIKEFESLKVIPDVGVIRDVITGSVPYDSIHRDIRYQGAPASDIKKYVDSLDVSTRQNLIIDVKKGLERKKKDKIKGLSSIDVGSDFFTAANARYNGSLELPTIINENGNKIELKLSSNDEFFDRGHDLIITIYDTKKGEDGVLRKKQYNFNVNIMNDFDSVMNDIWGKIKKAEEKYDKGEESDNTDQKNKSISPKHKEHDIERIARIYLGKWYTYTKTGKKKEAPESKKLAKFWVAMDKNTKGRGTVKYEDKPRMFKLYFDVRTAPTMKNTEKGGYSRKVKYPQAILDVYPEFPKWYEKLASYQGPDSNIRLGLYGPDSLYPDRIYTDEHDKFFDRLMVFAEKVAKYGYYPSDVRYISGRKSKHDQDDHITFTYSEKLKEKANKDYESTIKSLKNGKFKDIERGFYKGEYKVQDIPKKIIELIFEKTTLKK